MSQNDLSIANQGFASFRSDLNSALQALGSTNSGASAPSTTYANQLFYDTTNNILKIRNEDNDAFINLITLDQTNDKAKFDLDGTELILDADGDTSITADTDDQIDIKIAGSDVYQITATKIDLNGKELVLDADADTSITADTDDQIDVKVAGTDQITIKDGAVSPVTNNDVDLGTSSLGYKDIYAVGQLKFANFEIGDQTIDGNTVVFRKADETETMRIDSSGNVGIGTTSITTSTLGTSNKFLEVSAGTAGGSGTLVLSRNTTTDNDEVGGIRFVNANNADDDGLDADGKMIGAITARMETSDSNAGDDSGGHLTFNTKPEAGSFAERMRITSDGNVGIGTDSPSDTLDIERATGVVSLGLQSRDSSDTKINFGDNGDGDVGIINYAHNINAMIFTVNASERMRIGSTGSLNVMGVYNDTTTSSANVNVASDGHIRRVVSSRRYKNTINDATHGLKELLTLRSVTYKGNNEEFLVGGLIAEEVHDSGLTEFVEYDDDGKPDSLAYSNMVSLCIKAIQELSAKVDTLEARIATLESK